jgi:hypothetical protein
VGDGLFFWRIASQNGESRIVYLFCSTDGWAAESGFVAAFSAAAYGGGFGVRLLD